MRSAIGIRASPCWVSRVRLERSCPQSLAVRCEELSRVINVRTEDRESAARRVSCWPHSAVGVDAVAQTRPTPPN